MYSKSKLESMMEHVRGYKVILMKEKWKGYDEKGWGG
jgi:hypothetical protein